MTTLTFTPPSSPADTTAVHHAAAAIQNLDVVTQAIGALQEVLDGIEPYERILLKAAAGAGKTFALKRMVGEALTHDSCSRVGVTAFANKQVIPLAGQLGEQLGRDRVCLAVSKEWYERVPEWVHEKASVVIGYKEIPESAEVIIGTTHKFEGSARYIRDRLGNASNEETLFDVLFVDEAWQLPNHRYAKVSRMAPLTVGVGDVGQLPPLDPSQNPWRGDPGHNPYRAWPEGFDGDSQTWSRELPAVWRPTAAQLPLWRAFYTDWTSLTCVVGPGDRELAAEGISGESAQLWAQVGTGQPTLLEVDGLPEAEAPDIDQPLLSVLEAHLDALIQSDLTIWSTDYDGHGAPEERTSVTAREREGDNPVIAVLATRNAAVDDAQEMVDRLVGRHDVPDGWIVASTVDSWQGQTNTLTVAVHPLSGASELDAFNSAFGRLAVTCTRATHGLLLLSRSGLDELLDNSPAVPGTPLGEPGTRELPRQTHRRILRTFARATQSLRANG
ncbi:hypothetical protein [Janibacter cremeus]|uniref:AAA domain-containing protein n=1 Tax=Janibacter cremeus TaxID=1285192 RepID=A0A852VLT7_9MICO|nr:hypothetical protein [Janibacter cremeus]NYF96889.1 hypothetical protein [Janibacter cremeus]